MTSRKKLLAILVVVLVLLVVREVQWRVSDSHRSKVEAQLKSENHEYRATKRSLCFPMKRLVWRLPEEEQLSDSLFYLAAGIYAHCIEDELSLKVQGFVVADHSPAKFAEGLAWLRRELPAAKFKSGPSVKWEAKSGE